MRRMTQGWARLGLLGACLAASLAFVPAARAQAGPVLTLTKSGAPDPVAAGSQLTYTLTILDSADAGATGAVLVDPLPAHTTFVSASDGGSLDGGQVTWNLGAIDGGTNRAITLVVQVESPLANGTVLSNTATLSTDQTAPQSASVDVTVTSAPVLTLTKTGSPNPAVPGAPLTYTLTYGNTGNDQATNATLTDPLPAGVTFQSASGGGSYDSGTRTVTWTLGTLAGGSSGSVTLVVVPDASTPDGTVLFNSATLTADGALTSTTAALLVQRLPALSLRKTADPETATAGSPLTYTLTYQNAGGPTTNAVLVDPLPAGVTYRSSSAGGIYDAGTNTVSFDLGSLSGNDPFSVTIDVVLDPNVPDGTVLQNVARIEADGLPDAVASVGTVVRQPTAEVPTLGEFGLALLAALLAGVGAWRLRARAA